ncbi:hypothetical protein PIB30_084129, partial [Stylosanthes scabra]|nr:hypothetical protein [Stylosanthes scabra]
MVLEKRARHRTDGLKYGDGNATSRRRRCDERATATRREAALEVRIVGRWWAAATYHPKPNHQNLIDIALHHHQGVSAPSSTTVNGSHLNPSFSLSFPGSTASEDPPVLVVVTSSALLPSGKLCSCVTFFDDILHHVQIIHVPKNLDLTVDHAVEEEDQEEEKP